jgi:predicted RNA-binding Zn-ribbon protein involved in translation (DUF1610 family)
MALGSSSLLVFIAVLMACPLIGLVIGRYRTSRHVLVRKAFMRIAWPIVLGYFIAIAMICTVVYTHLIAGRGESPLDVIGCGMTMMGPIVAVLVVLLGERERTQRKLTHCVKCGYPVLGIRSDKCPECGEAVKTRSSPGIKS